VKASLGQSDAREDTTRSDDGLDAIAMWFDRARRTLVFASARTPLHALVPGESTVRTIEGEKPGLGYVGTPADQQWTNRSLQVYHGTVVVAATDGLIDQIGGPKHIAFGKRRLRDAILRSRAAPIAEVSAAIMKAHENYQAGHSRRDDVTLFCFRG